MSESTKAPQSAVDRPELDAYDRCLRMQTRLKAIQRLLFDTINGGHQIEGWQPLDYVEATRQVHDLVEELLTPMQALCDNFDQETPAEDPPAAAAQETGIRAALLQMAELPESVLVEAWSDDGYKTPQRMLEIWACDAVRIMTLEDMDLEQVAQLAVSVARQTSGRRTEKAVQA